MGATAQGEGLRGHAAAPGGSTGRGRAAWAGQPLSAAPCRVCSTRGPRLLPQWTRDRQPAHSLLRGQRCRASRRARVTRSTFSRVALPPIRPMRSTWGQGGGKLVSGIVTQLFTSVSVDFLLKSQRESLALKKYT